MIAPTPHNKAQASEVAPSVLVCSNPVVLDYIASTLLTDVVQFNAVRNMSGYTGLYNGKRISLMGIGIGIPSASIYINELMAFYGVTTMVGMGSYRPLQDSLSDETLIFATGCGTDSGLFENFFAGDFAPAANFELLNAAYETATDRGFELQVGSLMTTDSYYADEIVGSEKWAEYGVLALDMEGAALYTHGAKYQAKTLMISLPETKLHSQEALCEGSLLVATAKLALDTLIQA